MVLVDGEAITDIDTTAIFTISDLREELKRTNVDLRFAHVREHVMDVIRRADVAETIDPDTFFTSIHAGVDSYLEETQISSDS